MIQESSIIKIADIGITRFMLGRLISALTLECWHSLPVIGNDSNLLIVFYVQIMPDDFVMQLHRF
ncbi:hypothetical protein CS371_14605 (plasmid) [Serratia marcescens]|nr:hypothetical protein CS371_14605 [Serratia marcescens]